MTAGIVGLGLIGGSFAKAYAQAGHSVYALDTDRSTLAFAGVSGVLAGELTHENAKDCDVILVCVYPEAAIGFMEDFGPHFGSKPVVIDCCGTKAGVVNAGMKIAEKYGFTYVGGHPMAGTQFSGFKYSKATLFNGAPMVIVPPDFSNIVLLSHIKDLLEPAGFGSFSVTTAERHDKLIAFTSQLAHVVSNAYVKSPTAQEHKGFSAGSYRDLTRVAWLNPTMWAELFLDNKDNLLNELDTIIRNLTEYREALANEDRERLIKLLDDGKRLKEEVDRI
ncbi:MAG: prephenate dehydrogenase [Lachnospiraceae bacterium]|nr:prephenate dehydrogenase [Lachnospiraceae bacterium]